MTLEGAQTPLCLGELLLSTLSPEPREVLLGLDLNFLPPHSPGSGPLQTLWIPRQM